MIERVAYNGVVFSRPSLAEISATPVKDESQPTIAYTRYEITITAVVAYDTADASDDAMARVRQRLTRPGGLLQVDDTGFGPIRVSVSGSEPNTHQDVKGGPFPEVITWSPIAGTLAAEVTWKVVSCFNDCPASKYNDILGFSYEWSTELDARGLTTRTMSGELRIVPKRQGRLILTSADRYRNSLVLAVPHGFRREKQSYKTSSDKTTLSFAITDVQIDSPNAYPPGVTHISAEHEVAWNRRSAGTPRGTLSMDITLAQGEPRARAYQIFLDIAKQRISAARLNTKGVLLDAVYATEHLFSHDLSFTASYRILQQLKDLLQNSGFWQPIGTDWRVWAKSMAVPWSSRGTAFLVLDGPAGSVVDQCGGVLTLPTEKSLPPSQYAYRSQALKNERPDPAHSYLDYGLSVETSEDHRPAKQAPMQEPVEPGSPGYKPYQGSWDPRSPNPENYGPPTGDNDIVQVSGRPIYSARVRGYAVRAGFPVTKPRLQSIGERFAIEVRSRFHQETVGDFLGIPVYRAAWNIEYELDNSPGVTGPPQNPMEPHDGSTI